MKWLALVAATCLYCACNVNHLSNSPLAGPQLPGTAATSVQVDISSGAAQLGPAAYGTNPLPIAAGVQVTWTNSDSMPHTVTADDGTYDSGVIAPGQSYSRTFNAPGTYTYFCTIHGKAAMNGTLVVGLATNGTAD